MNPSQVLYGSFLPCRTRRKFLLIFCKTNGSWTHKYIKGFNHVVVAEVFDEILVILEPTFMCVNVMFRSYPSPGEWKDYTIIEVETVQRSADNILLKQTSFANRLVRTYLSSCATICQYIMGCDLGCFLPSTLYSALTTKDSKYLKSKGIVRVKLWAES